MSPWKPQCAGGGGHFHQVGPDEVSRTASLDGGAWPLIGTSLCVSVYVCVCVCVFVKQQQEHHIIEEGLQGSPGQLS